MNFDMVALSLEVKQLRRELDRLTEHVKEISLATQDTLRAHQEMLRLLGKR